MNYQIDGTSYLCSLKSEETFVKGDQLSSYSHSSHSLKFFLIHLTLELGISPYIIFFTKIILNDYTIFHYAYGPLLSISFLLTLLLPSTFHST